MGHMSIIDDDTMITPATPAKTLDPPSGRSTQVREIKILLPKHKLQRLLILLAQVQAGNMSENLVNEIW